MSACSTTRGGLVLALLAASACTGGSETGNPVVPTEVALSVHSSAPQVVVVSPGVQDGATGIAEAWVAFGESRFLGPDECARFGDLDMPGETRLIADLAEPGAILSLPSPERERCGLLLPLEMDSTELPDDAPAELGGSSVLVRGARGDGVPFELRYPEHDELELAVEGGALDPSEQPLVLSFDVAAWLSGLDLGSATLEEDGSILIDAAHNRALLGLFELNLACSLALHADEDEDGRFTPGEPLLAMCAPDGI